MAVTFVFRPLLMQVVSSILRAKAYASYVGWMFAERVWMVLSGIVVGFWVIRVLGPEEFGRFSAANSVAAVFAGLSIMGLETVVVRRLSSGEINPKAVLMTASVVRLAGSFVYAMICWVVSWLIFPSSSDVALMAFIIAASTIFRVTDVVGLWLQVENYYGRAARIRILIRLAGDVIRVVFIINRASVAWFAVAILIESIVACIVFLVAGRVLLKKHGSPNLALARSLFADGRPVMISILVAAFYARIDQLVLYKITGALDNGYYAAAVRISEAFNVVLLSVGTVAAAHFGRLESAPKEKVDEELRTYYRSVVLAGFVASAVISIFAGPIVRVIYGPNFAPAIPLLRVHVWTFCLVCTSVAMEPWFYHHRKLRYFVPKTLMALVFSMPAVFLGTYFFGPIGTAVAVVATYAISVFATNALLPGVRDAFRFQVRAFR